MNPTVSVIIGAYNAENTIRETIESVLSQTFTDFELIIVDDGSTDNTKNICEEYRKRDNRVRYVWQKNSKLSAARNKGVEVSKSNYVTIIDADDLWAEDKIQKQVLAIRSKKDTIILTGVHRFTICDGVKIWREITMPPVDCGKCGDIRKILLLSSFQMVVFNTALMEKNNICELGGWNQDMWTAHDWEFWIRAKRKCEFINIEEPLFYYRKHSASLSKSEDLLKVLGAHEEIIRHYYKNGLTTESDFSKALICRRLEISEFLIYQKELEKAFKVFLDSLKLAEGWKSRDVWKRGVEIMQLASRRMFNEE